MKCRYCSAVLAPLRTLTDGEFCCDEHRRAFHEQEPLPAGSAARSGVPQPANTAASAEVAVSGLPARAPQPTLAERVESPAGVAGQAGPVQASQDLQAMARSLNAFDFQPSRRNATEDNITPAIDSEPRAASGSNPAPLPSFQAAVSQESTPQAKSAWEQDSSLMPDEPSGLSAPAEESPVVDHASGHPSSEALGSALWLKEAWHKAPKDLRILILALPVLLVLAIGPSMPKVKVKVSSEAASQVQQLVATQWKGLQQNISSRAAIAFSDDFRSGLDNWVSHSNLTRSWSYDAAGFVRPGPLAIFKPTTELSDYRFEFLEEIDQKAMGCAFRASDLDNYYAVKLVVVRPGPLPLVHLVRYPVIKGKEGPHVEKALPFTTRSDTLYRVLLDVRGGDFTIMVQGQVVDFWTDNRLRSGGVGFFEGRGERSRLRWVEVSHQYDALGRLCAYLAPYGIDAKNGSLN